MAPPASTKLAPKSVDDLKGLLEDDIKVKVAGENVVFSVPLHALMLL